MRAATGFLVMTTLAAPVADAQQTISPEEFERMTEGRNVEYTQDGVVDGQEQHLPGRIVVWQYPSGECMFGRWTPRGDAVCFTYEYSEHENCVTYYRQRGALRARDKGLDTEWNFYNLKILPGDPLPCPSS